MGICGSDSNKSIGFLDQIKNGLSKQIRSSGIYFNQYFQKLL